MMFTRRRRRRVADWLIAWLFARSLRRSCEERRSKLLAFHQYNATEVPWRSLPCTQYYFAFALSIVEVMYIVVNGIQTHLLHVVCKYEII
jgi:hypothetical protein